MTGPKKLVVGGATGFLGSPVTRQLVDGGDDVRVLIPEGDLGWRIAGTALFYRDQLCGWRRAAASKNK